jgi:L-alanine-DL-glutamate epimerase-like enolase superfamily enzyme
MRIVRVRTAKLELPDEHDLLSGDPRTMGVLHVVLETDTSLAGETVVVAFDPRHVDVVRPMVDLLGEEVIGEDPTATERIWQRLLARAGSFGRSGVAMIGVSAIDRVCWSVAAQAAGRPIHRLLGGVRDSVPVYGSGLWLFQTTDELIAEARTLVQRGFGGIKMRIGKARMDEDVERVRAVRDAVGPDIALMVDANKRFTVDHAIRLGRRLEPCNLAWFEEPVQAHDLSGSARVAAALDTPVASGESEYTVHGFRAMLEAGAADILMPDISRIGGVTGILKVAHLAEAFDVPVSPHHHPYESIQVLGGIANGTWLESVPWFDGLYEEPLAPVDGRVDLPDDPVGFRLDLEALERLRAG